MKHINQTRDYEISWDNIYIKLNGLIADLNTKEKTLGMIYEFLLDNKPSEFQKNKQSPSLESKKAIINQLVNEEIATNKPDSDLITMYWLDTVRLNG